jgi:hypothetical protein
MPRLWTALCLALAVVALGVFAASCGAGGTSYRILDAIANYDYQATGGFDITINGSTEFTSVQFTNINPPGKDSYKSVSPGSEGFDVFPHAVITVGGTPVFSSSMSFNSHTQYTVILMGNNTFNPYVAQAFTDNNVAPASGDFEFRVIDVSNNLPNPIHGQPGGVDIYIVGSPTVVTGPNPPSPNANLGYGEATAYISNPAGTWWLVVTNHGGHIPIINPTSYSPGALQIETIVLVDGINGGGVGSPLIFTDLN